MKFLTKRRGSVYFQVFPWHFYFMRGHLFVKLTEHDDSAADIIVHSEYIYVLLQSVFKEKSECTFCFPHINRSDLNYVSVFSSHSF